MKKYFCPALFFSFLFIQQVFPQSSPYVEIKLKNISDTVLGRRSLLLPEPFDGYRAMRKLFPGRFYDRPREKKEDPFFSRLVSWECRSCVPKPYTDVNQDSAEPFPYKEGVATRLLGMSDFSDAEGRQYKVVFFNHSQHDADGILMSRFTGGLLGLAKFVKTDSGWRLLLFQPALAAYGAFSQSPVPQTVKLGEGQYGFLVDHINGGAGGPYWDDYFLLAERGGHYRQVLVSSGVGTTSSLENPSDWKSIFRVSSGGKQRFNNFVITIKGVYYANADNEGLPELKGSFKNGEHGNFTIVRVYEYKGRQGYVLKKPAFVRVVKK